MVICSFILILFFCHETFGGHLIESQASGMSVDIYTYTYTDIYTLLSSSYFSGAHQLHVNHFFFPNAFPFFFFTPQKGRYSSLLS